MLLAINDDSILILQSEYLKAVNVLIKFFGKSCLTLFELKEKYIFIIDYYYIFVLSNLKEFAYDKF